MTRAYDELYLECAQDTLGHACDFAVNTVGISPAVFSEAFCVSGVAEQFGKGNVLFLAGHSGCELVRIVIDKVSLPLPEGKDPDRIEDVMYQDRSPEYWGGWVLAYYQWDKAVDFRRIFDSVPLQSVIAMYHPYHEADISKTVSALDRIIFPEHEETRLARIRRLNKYSQAVLAAASGVNVRQIQLFEQRQRDINKAGLETVIRLSRALQCRPEDLYESTGL